MRGSVQERGAYLAAAFAAALAGCTVHAVSPPVVPADLETAATVGEGHLAVAGSISANTSYDDVLGESVDVRTGTGRLTYGIVDGVDVRVGAYRYRLDPGSLAFTRPVRHDVAGGWGGAKVELVPRRRRSQPMLSFEAAVGGGRSEVGGFVGPDLGLLFSFENPYVVPFVGAGLGVSVPVDARPLPVDVNALDEDDSVSRLVPRTTYAYRTTTGVKAIIPLGPRDALGRPDGTLALLAGGSLVYLSDGDYDYVFLGVTVGLELVLPSLTGGAKPQTTW